MKRKLLSVLLMLMLTGSATYAAGVETEFSKETSVLTITADFGENNAYTRATGMIVKAGTALPSVEDYTVENQVTQDNIVAQVTGVTDKNGKCTFAPVTISDFSGDAVLYVGIYGGESLLNKELFLSSRSDVFTFVDNIQGCTTNTQIKSILDSEVLAPSFDADMTWYKELSDAGRLQVATEILAHKNAGRYATNNTSRIQNIDDDIITSSVIVYASEKKDVSLIKDLLNIEKSSFSDRYKGIIKVALGLDGFRQLQSGKDSLDASDAIYSAVAENTFANANQFKGAVTAGVINHKLRGITVWTEVDEILETYKDELAGLDFAKLAQKETNQQTMTAIYNGVPYNRADSLISRVNEILNGESNQGAGGSGGGGGGSSSANKPSDDKYSGEVGIASPSQDKINVQGSADRIFVDVPKSHWAAGAIEALAFEGIISGSGENTFEPERTITREEFVQMLATCFELKDAQAECNFADIKSGAWYERAVASMQQKGIVNGISTDAFGIGMNITRQDMAAIAYRTLAYKNAQIASEEVAECKFTDNESISDYAKGAVSFMYDKGIISGMTDGSFAPKMNATRAQAARIIYGLQKYAENN